MVSIYGAIIQTKLYYIKIFIILGSICQTLPDDVILTLFSISTYNKVVEGTLFFVK